MPPMLVPLSVHGERRLAVTGVTEAVPVLEDEVVKLDVAGANTGYYAARIHEGLDVVLDDPLADRIRVLRVFARVLYHLCVHFTRIILASNCRPCLFCNTFVYIQGGPN